MTETTSTTGATKSKAEEIFDRVNAVIADGTTTKTKAYEIVAAERGLSPNSVRGAYYQHGAKLRGGSVPRAPKTPVDPIEAAVAQLRKAVEQIDRDVQAAEERATAARTAFEEMRDSAASRKASLERKIAALSADDEAPASEPAPVEAPEAPAETEPEKPKGKKS